MIRKRFPSIRTTRIAAWTTVAVAWAIAIVGRQVAAEAPTGAAEPVPSTTTTAAVDSATASLPAMPEEGLTIIRYTPAPPPPPQTVVRQVVVASPVASSPAVSTSQGS